jgi:glycosyltransferase involved in cell wall biosynthesis
MSVATVIPVRNRAKFIERALNSVASQTYQPAEIIVVDDASTDGTPDIVISLAKEIPKIHLVTLQENVGAAEARNLGVREARSDLIAFLDSDDIWYPQKIEKQILEFRYDKSVVAVFSGSRVIYNDRSFSYIPSPDVTLADLYFSNKCSTTSSALITKKALLEVGGFDRTLTSSEDWDLFIRLAEIGKIRVVQEELIEFLNHEEDRISNNKIGLLKGDEIVRSRIYNRISDPTLLRKVRSSHQCTLADIFSSLIFEPGRATRHALTGIALAPSAQSFRILARVAKRVCQKAKSRG